MPQFEIRNRINLKRNGWRKFEGYLCFESDKNIKKSDFNEIKISNYVEFKIKINLEDLKNFSKKFLQLRCNHVVKFT